MIILDFFRENINGSINTIDIYAYRTGYLFESENENNISVTDLIIKGRLKEFKRDNL